MSIVKPLKVKLLAGDLRAAQVFVAGFCGF